MSNINEVRTFFKDDRFANDILHIEIISAEHGSAVCQMKILPEHMNAGGAVQGGVIFTLADYTFAVAANFQGTLTVSLNCNISYIRPPKGKILQAHASQVSETRSVGFYEVVVFDEIGTNVAMMQVTGFKKEEKLPFANGE